MPREIDGAPAVRVIHDKEQDKAADVVMDHLLAADQAVTAHDSASEREREKREEIAFMTALGKEVDERLRGAGIRVTKVAPAIVDHGEEGENRGYRVYCRDATSRPYEADISYDDFFALQAQHGADAGQRLITLVCDKILQARQLWFMRMGLH